MGHVDDFDTALFELVSPSAVTDVKVEDFEGRQCRLRETNFQLLTIYGTLPGGKGALREGFAANPKIKPRQPPSPKNRSQKSADEISGLKDLK